MLAEDLIKLKQDLKQILPEEGIGTVLKAMKSHLPSDTPKYNVILQLESRLNEANLKRVKGILSDEQLQIQYNQLRNDLLTFIDDLTPADFSKEAAKKAKTGSVLYKVPREMELQQRCKCIVRLAYEESIIIQNIEITSDTSIQSVRVSDAMEVAMIDPEGGKNFKITSISSPEQFLEDDEFSEWVFYVIPLTVGSHPIILKVSVLELVAGKERKKEIVLEEIVTIITEPVEEVVDDKPFHNAGYSFSFSDDEDSKKAGGAVAPGEGDGSGGGSGGSPGGSKGGGGAGGATGALKKYSMLLGAFTVVLIASWAMGLFTFISWQEVLWRDTIEGYEGFMVDNRDSKYFMIAKQHRDLKVAIRDKSDEKLVDFCVDYPDSELKEKAKAEFRRISNDDLDERIRKERERRNKSKPEKDKRIRDKGDNDDEEKEESTSEEIPEEEDPDPTEGELSVVEEEPEPIPPAEEVPGKVEPPKNKAPDRIKEPIKWLNYNMEFIEGGKFTMGCDGDDCLPFTTPSRSVKVKDFKMCKYEVTQALWKRIMGNNPSYSEVKTCGACPVENVNFSDVKKFIRKLNRETGEKYRLPSEAEWEFAARGGTKSGNNLYAGSNDPNRVAVYRENSPRRPQKTGTKAPNELGLYDMSGSVAEWCQDDWNGSFKGAPKNGNPFKKDEIGNSKVTKGGSWMDDPVLLRIDNREMEFDSTRDHRIGVRLATDK